MMLSNHDIGWFISSGFEESILSSLNFRLNLVLEQKGDYKDIPTSKKTLSMFILLSSIIAEIRIGN